jgi:hypothetical protein
MATLVDAIEVVPRLFTGDYASCDDARRYLNCTCINVGPNSHTTDPRCNFIPLCTGPGGVVSSAQLTKIMTLIFGAFSQSGTYVLLHGPDGISEGPLAIALYLQQQYALTLPQAYQWVWRTQPQARDLSALCPPRAG